MLQNWFSFEINYPKSEQKILRVSGENLLNNHVKVICLLESFIVTLKVFSSGKFTKKNRPSFYVLTEFVIYTVVYREKLDKPKYSINENIYIQNAA